MAMREELYLSLEEQAKESEVGAMSQVMQVENLGENFFPYSL